MTSDFVAVSQGNNEVCREQTVAQIRSGEGSGSIADVTLLNHAPAVNEVRSLCNFSLDTAAEASPNGRRSREKRSLLCRGGGCWATKSEGIEGRFTDEKAACLAMRAFHLQKK